MARETDPAAPWQPALFAAGFVPAAPGAPGAGAPTGPLWYPAEPGTQEATVRLGSAYRGRAACHAPLATASPRWPAAVLVHGLRGAPIDLSWLGERLARAGYIVVAPELADSSYRAYHPQRAPQVWRRAAQIRAALDALLADPQWGARVDGDRLAVAAHSAGASAAFVAAGAQVDAKRFLQRYPECGPVPAAVAADPRIRAIIALAAGTGTVFANEGIAACRVPVLLVSGGRDRQCPDRFNAERYSSQLPHARWLRLPRCGHFVFKPTCSLYGRVRAPGLCWDALGVSRTRVHDRVANAAISHLRDALH